LRLEKAPLFVAMLSTIFLAPIFSSTLSQSSQSETRLVVVVTGLPEGKQVKIYVNGSEIGTASITSPLVLTFPIGSTITLTADIYLEGSWGYRYELIGVRKGNAPPETQPSIKMDSDLIVLVCEYESYHILLSPLLIPLYALLILIGIWSIVRWLSSLMQPLQKESPQTVGVSQNLRRFAVTMKRR